jgi:hypothetical protein
MPVDPQQKSATGRGFQPRSEGGRDAASVYRAADKHSELAQALVRSGQIVEGPPEGGEIAAANGAVQMPATARVLLPLLKIVDQPK